jgi:crotonobetainyl-CoA:carnitine CoA-transferase CaiB-like acyl-CoA transferase
MVGDVRLAGGGVVVKRRPLDGVRVLDLTMMWAGPYATRMLAEMGAEVIKIESPRAWDNIRTLFPRVDVVDDPWNSAFYFAEYNHDKKSVTLDLAVQAGRDAFLKLVANSEVVIENYRADVMDNLGLTDEVLLGANPALVLVSMAGFGKTGGDRDNVGYGPIIEMMSGLMSLSGYEPDTPQKCGISYGDPVAGLAAAAAVTLGLIRRRRTGQGSRVDLAQLEVSVTMAGVAFAALARTGAAPPATGNRHARWAPQGCYQVRGDDQWVVVSCTDDREWATCAEVIGRPDLAGLGLEERRARHDELDAAIAAWAAPLDGRVAVDVLQESGVPAGQVLDMRTIKDDPHLYERGYWVRIPNEKMHPYRKSGVAWRLVEAKPTIVHHAPFFGADNHEVLTAVGGLSDDEVARLEADGVIADHPLRDISYG